jgi:predicted ribonuclease YlaK
MLVFDTNILLSHLSVFTALVESGAWTTIVPLPVVAELDGLSKQTADREAAGLQARAALSYLKDNIRKYSTQLKVQTTKGNYLTHLNVRTEMRENGQGPGGRGVNMDERILGVAEFQRDQWVDRSILLQPLRAAEGAQMAAVKAEQEGGGKDKAKVVLVTMDRNLRLRAMGRGVEAVGEKEIRAVV